MPLPTACRATAHPHTHTTPHHTGTLPLPTPPHPTLHWALTPTWVAGFLDFQFHSSPYTPPAPCNTCTTHSCHTLTPLPTHIHHHTHSGHGTDLCTHTPFPPHSPLPQPPLHLPRLFPAYCLRRTLPVAHRTTYLDWVVTLLGTPLPPRAASPGSLVPPELPTWTTICDTHSHACTTKHTPHPLTFPPFTVRHCCHLLHPSDLPISQVAHAHDHPHHTTPHPALPHPLHTTHAAFTAHTPFPTTPHTTPPFPPPCPHHTFHTPTLCPPPHIY